MAAHNMWGPKIAKYVGIKLMNMNLVLFDLGGTLIDDPFEEVLNKLYNECLKD